MFLAFVHRIRIGVVGRIIRSLIQAREVRLPTRSGRSSGRGFAVPSQIGQVICSVFCHGNILRTMETEDWHCVCHFAAGVRSHLVLLALAE